MKSTLLSIIGTQVLSNSAITCGSIADDKKTDCGFSGIDQTGCEAKGCCWKPSQVPGQNVPWCFAKKEFSCTLDFSASGTNFTEENQKSLLTNFTANLNIQGTGMVVAAPDTETPGGSYYYHWARDGALSTYAYLLANDFDLDKVDTNMKAYSGWVASLQGKTPNEGLDIRDEVKYEIPAGNVYTGGWCRPQNDGPGLRALTLMTQANMLIDAGRNDDVASLNLWTGDDSKMNGGAIAQDLDHVVENQTSETCDLWEEIRSDDMFWNKFTMRRALRLGAKFATKMGDTARASTYTAKIADLETQLNKHWNGNYLWEATQRPIDGSVVHAINVAFKESIDDDFLNVLDPKVAQTVSSYNSAFCKEYPINVTDNNSKIPGIFQGRYPGDSQAGGNPWQLLTATLADLFYNAGIAVKSFKGLTDEQKTAWAKVLPHLGSIDKTDVKSIVGVFRNAGDSVMQRIYAHVKDSDFHISEQIDKNNGKQVSAENLTWSQANILTALKRREFLESKKCQWFDTILGNECDLNMVIEEY